MIVIDIEQARAEALAARLTEQQAEALAAACRKQTADVREHRIAYNAASWPELPPPVGDPITRGDVFDLAEAPAIDVFTASYVFGMGRRGYGRARYDRIRANTPNLDQLLERVRTTGITEGPISAYAQLYGGPDWDNRTRAGSPGWSRIAHFGPAFFTKFLYFAVPGALILDARLSARVAHLTGSEHGYLKNGRPVAWTPFRYAVYMDWMTQAAADVSDHLAPRVVTPDLLELTLFNLPLSALPPRQPE